MAKDPRKTKKTVNDPAKADMYNRETLAPGDAIAPTTANAPAVQADKYTTRTDPRKGGMAIVWRAYDSDLRREVAYKELKPESSQDDRFRAMFLHEARVTGQLEHPNIVPVYELGKSSSDERPYYTMKYVRGKTLREAIEEYHSLHDAEHFDSIELRRLLNVFNDICNAIAYAHSRGVIHRDLKPDNVMVGEFGEVIVLDWGLAKFIGSNESSMVAMRLSDIDTESTRIGVRKGTPAYWAPEQAEGETLQLDFRTDIYGLGGILYEILTGRPPHGEELQADEEEADYLESLHPKEVVPAIPPSLDAICSKALSRKRDDRYSMVSQMQKDLECWAADELVSAYEETWRERMVRTVRRNRYPLVISGIVVMLAIVVMAWSFIERRTNRAALQAREMKGLSEFAGAEGTKLESNIENLRQDVTFLSKLDEVRFILAQSKPELPDKGAEGKATAAADAPANAADAKQVSPDLVAAKEHLQGIFKEFLKEKHHYMQVRLIDANGNELVRMERKSPGAPPTEYQGKLPNKGDRPYFKNTKKADPGDWYLSRIELNQENNRKQKDVPVIRGAVPVHDEDNAFKGIVIINSHFQELVGGLQRFQSRSASGLVYLTDEEGQFIYHPNNNIAFCFERKLDYRIQQLYGNLDRVFQKGNIGEDVIPETLPQVAVLVRPEATGRIRRASEANEVMQHYTERLSKALNRMEASFPDLKSKVSEEADAILYGYDEATLAKAVDELERKAGLQMEREFVPAKFRGKPQAVHFRRLRLELGNEDRFLGLALVLSHEEFEAQTGGNMFLWVTLWLVLIVACVLVFRFSAQVPTTRNGGTRRST